MLPFITVYNREQHGAILLRQVECWMMLLLFSISIFPKSLLKIKLWGVFYIPVCRGCRPRAVRTPTGCQSRFVPIGLLQPMEPACCTWQISQVLGELFLSNFSNVLGINNLSFRVRHACLILIIFFPSNLFLFKLLPQAVVIMFSFHCYYREGICYNYCLNWVFLHWKC